MAMRTINGNGAAVTADTPVLECRNLHLSYFTRAGVVPTSISS